MLACSVQHSDIVCRMASLRNGDGSPGFIFGMDNAMRMVGSQDCEHELSYAELDILTKVLDIGPQVLRLTSQQELAIRLGSSIRNLMDRVREHSNEVITL